MTVIKFKKESSKKRNSRDSKKNLEKKKDKRRCFCKRLEDICMYILYLDS